MSCNDAFNSQGKLDWGGGGGGVGHLYAREDVHLILTLLQGGREIFMRRRE